MIGHTKGEHDFDAIGRDLRELRADPRFEFLTSVGDGGARARRPARSVRANRDDEARYQVQREFGAVMGEERNAAQSHRLQELIRWDCDALLDLGCGSGYWSERIARMHPWMRVTGVDVGQPFIEKARERYRLANLDFRQEDFSPSPFADATFDVVYADNTIEHAFDVELTLREVFRVLRPNGTLVAALPPDGGTRTGPATTTPGRRSPAKCACAWRTRASRTSRSMSSTPTARSACRRTRRRRTA